MNKINQMVRLAAEKILNSPSVNAHSNPELQIETAVTIIKLLVVEELCKELGGENKELIRLVHDMHADHVKYPQLQLPRMQAERLDQIMKLL